MNEGERQIAEWLSTCEKQISASGGDKAALQAVREIAKKLLDEDQARTAESAARFAARARRFGQ